MNGGIPPGRLGGIFSFKNGRRYNVCVEHNVCVERHLADLEPIAPDVWHGLNRY